MMNNSSSVPALRPRLAAWLGWLCLALLAAPAVADGDGLPSGPPLDPGSPGSTSGNGGTSASSPGDEVTSLPRTIDPSGTTFIGPMDELRAVLVRLRGAGRITTTTLPDGQTAVTLTGDYRVELDRAALARSSVRVLFRNGNAFDNSTARLRIGDSVQRLLDADRIPLPLGRLAQDRALQGDLVGLAVRSARAGAHVEASFGPRSIVVTQNLRRINRMR